jgi:uncharacterized delta-60 repeat protein
LEGRQLLSFGLDPSFNKVGWRTTGFVYNNNGNTDSTNSAADAVALQTVGGQVRPVAVGTATTTNGDGTGVALTRFTTSGGIDTSFGGNGQTPGQALNFFGTPQNLPDSVDQANAVLVRPVTQSIIVAGSTVSGAGSSQLLNFMNLIQYSSSGSVQSLDSFYNAYTDQFGNVTFGDAFANAVALQPDGKILVVGTANTPTDQIGPNSIIVARLKSDLSQDTSFGSNTGLASTVDGQNGGLGFERLAIDGIADAAVVQPATGKILVAGTDFDNAGDALVQLNPNGSVDTSFGGKGTGFAAPGLGFGGSVTSVALEPIAGDSKILVTGYISGSGKYFVARYNSNGTPDQSFGSNGQVFSKFLVGASAGPSSIAAMKIEADGKIVVAGEVISSFKAAAVVARFNTNGSLDTSFGPSGQATTDFGGKGGRATGLAIQGDGKIVVDGTSNGQFAIARFSNSTTTPPGDYNGDKRTDIAVFQPSTSTFFIQNSGAFPFGQGTAYGGDPIPVAADFTGAGKDQLAVFQPSTATFYIQGVGAVPFGQGTLYGGDPIPVVADYAGTGKAQLAVFQPSTSTFYIQGVGAVPFGQGTLYGGDPIPVVADYAGTGKAQLAVFQPSTATFYIQGVGAVPFGQGTLYGGDPIPVVNDYTGSGKAQLAVFQPSTATFYIAGVGAVPFGQGTLYGGNPIPVAADYAVAGKAQVAVFQPSTSTFYIQGVGAVPFGQGTLYGGDPYPIPLPTAYRVGGVLVERSVGGGTATGSLTTRSAAGFEPMVTADAPGSIPPVVILLPGPGDATSGPATKSSATPTARIHVVAIDGSVS